MSRNELEISTRYIDDVVILDLDGNVLIGTTSDKLHSMLRALAFEDKKRILLNLAKVRTVDSTGLGTIVGGYTNLGKQGCQLKVENLSVRILELMHITKLYTVFEIFDHEKIALESFHHPYRLHSSLRQPLAAKYGRAKG
ncbi:MAG TPA: STAS domain-containing protein [Pyrinomonadaceae bacterium]|nr:STAS domain-containing protein [Pyrinomonadaceae bacterium]